MSRSIWKGAFIKTNLIKNLNSSNLKIWSRSSTIASSFLNKTVQIYNGKTFKKLLIKREHLGFKFGEFCFTRNYSKKKKKKNGTKK